MMALLAATGKGFTEAIRPPHGGGSAGLLGEQRLGEPGIEDQMGRPPPSKPMALH
jgi:hypothetical protein